MLNVKSLLTKILNEGICLSKSTTITGEIKTSTKNLGGTNLIGFGYYSTSVTTFSDLWTEIRYSSGCFGTIATSAAETVGGVSIPSGTYYYIYCPHRSGGKNGAAQSDNHNYGCIFIIGTYSSFRFRTYVIRCSGGSIQSTYTLYNYYYNRYTLTKNSSSTDYVLNPSISSLGERQTIYTSLVQRSAHVASVMLVIQCVTSSSSWTTTRCGSVSPTPKGTVYAALTDGNGNTLQIQITTSGYIQCRDGDAGKIYSGTVTYVTSTT